MSVEDIQLIDNEKIYVSIIKLYFIKTNHQSGAKSNSILVKIIISFKLVMGI